MQPPPVTGTQYRYGRHYTTRSLEGTLESLRKQLAHRALTPPTSPVSSFYDTLPPHPWFILTFTQQLRNPSPERGLPVLRLIFVVIVTLNKRRTSGHRLRLYNPLRSFDCQSEESMLLGSIRDCGGTRRGPAAASRACVTTRVRPRVARNAATSYRGTRYLYL